MPQDAGPDSFPQRIGIIGDLGQVCTNVDVEQLLQKKSCRINQYELCLNGHNNLIILEKQEYYLCKSGYIVTCSSSTLSVLSPQK